MIAPTAPTDAVRALLAANELPVDDLDDPAIELFALHDGDRLAGVVGVQWLAGCALLRSLAVDGTARSAGLGAQLCDAVVRAARARGCAALWLLTTSAQRYFERRGFAVIERAHVPEAVRATAQYTALCPASAVVMMRAVNG